MRLFFGLFLLTVVTLFGSCRDEIGESLFEMDYPPKSFTLAAGTNTFVSSVVAVSNIPTNYPSFLNASGYSATDVTKIVPRYARLVSVDGLDTGFLSEVSVRICPNSQQDCTAADEAFYIDDIYRRNISNINLLPALGNFKDLLSSGLYKLEVVFFLGEISPYSVDFRLEYGFEAFK
ncbi:hypothetical protein [Lewinella cohaerens]|uniref:hypothetical protein n=1 Tax=Lewinella cohaerens TaxID=70995 RepID=UPI000377F446|nr:hypothetical protein [Lewinella cohaerens]